MNPVNRDLPFPSLLVAAVLAAVSPVALAQDTTATAADDQSLNPADRSLVIEFAALGLMNDTLGAMLPSAQKRVELLTGYIKSKSLDDDFAGYAAPAFNAGATFNQAFAEAQDEAKLSAPTMQEDHDTLAREVNAQMGLVQGSWDRLQALRKKTWDLTSFIRSKKMFDDYHAWAVKETADEAVKAKADADAKRAAADAAARNRQAQKTSAMQQLQQRWDKIPYSTGVDFNYHFSQGSEATPNDFPEGNGSYNGDNYWNGSYYNGYADPYYDVWGGPGWVGGWGSYWRGRGHGTGDFHPAAGGAGRAGGGRR
jgi:uncharacterized protein (DUF2147 family)